MNSLPLRIFARRAFARAAVIVLTALCASQASANAGCAIAIGGALKPDNATVWKRVVAEAGGPGARFAVFASAAADPEKSAATIIKNLERHGARAEHIPVAVNLKSPDWTRAVDDPALIAKVKASRGVYFAGGSQERITRVLFTKDGKETAMLKAILEVQRTGGVVAGSSAGAAIMSETMFVEPPPVLDILKFGLKPESEIGRGLGFAGPGVMVDQHFLKRGRFGRLLPALVQAKLELGIGVDEDTAALFCGGTVEVIGAKGALVIDLHGAKRDDTLTGFNIRDARLTYLDRGDRYELATRTVKPSAAKLAGKRIDPNSAGFKPYYTENRFSTDVLADTVVVDLMSHLVDGRQKEVIGLAFDAQALTQSDAPAARQPALGFEFRFRRGPNTLGWFTSAFGGEDYTIANVLLDVTPITMARPLYKR